MKIIKLINPREIGTFAELYIKKKCLAPRPDFPVFGDLFYLKKTKKKPKKNQKNQKKTKKNRKESNITIKTAKKKTATKPKMKKNYKI
jgi:hypothetical protein